MLRNSFLEPYQTQKNQISEFEKEMLAHDENHLLNLERPLSERGIVKLPNTTLPNFIDDIMCNKNINKLLYSSNANKELDFYQKQKQFLLRNTTSDVKQNPFSTSKNRRPYESVFLKKKKLAMFQIIKDNISMFKLNKSRSMKLLKKKNKEFQKKQISSNKLSTQLFFKPINDIRIEGYKKAVEVCLNKSSHDNNFPLPDISFNMNDVYSRLYYNAILNPIKIKPYNLDEDMKICNSEIDNKYRNTNVKTFAGNNEDIHSSDRAKSLFYKRITKRKLNQDFNSPVNNYNTFYNKSKLPDFKLNKVLKGNDGKEFSIKPTPFNYRKCLGKNSGGPKMNKKKYKKMLRRLLNKNSSFYKDTKGIINVNSYRDKDKNSNLNIAIKRNNEKFVQYFLNKKYNPNEQNKYGDTALHLSMKNKNIEIIKLLLDKGADITIKNKKGITPYDLASKEIKNEFKLDNIMILKRPKKYY